jgi:hypothetical protein
MAVSDSSHLHVMDRHSPDFQNGFHYFRMPPESIGLGAALVLACVEICGYGEQNPQPAQSFRHHVLLVK